MSASHRTLKLTLKVQNPRDLSNGSYVAPWGGADTTIGRTAHALLARIGQGIGQGLAPSLALDGMGGTYVLRDAKRNPVAAFKPRDEEPFAPNNPRGLAGKMGQPGINPAIPSGEAHLREVTCLKRLACNCLKRARVQRRAERVASPHAVVARTPARGHARAPRPGARLTWANGLDARRLWWGRW